MKAKDLKNSILQMAVEGKLVPQDPSDEPASVLLERIREEKHRLIAEGKAKFPRGGESIIYIGSDGSPYEKRVDARGHVLNDKCIADEVPFEELPEGWAWVRLEDCCSAIVDCPHSTPSYLAVETGYSAIDTNCMDDDWRLTGLRSLSQESYEKRTMRYAPQAGDIVFSREGSIGRSVILREGNICLGQRVMLLSCNEVLLFNRYCQAALSSPYAWKLYRAANIGTGVKHINVSMIKAMLVPVPPLAEQRRIVERVDELMPLVEEYGKLEDAREKMDAELPGRLRKSVLQMAVQGKLVPQDPDDEPASALLASIREQRRELIKQKKMKAPKGGESVIFRGSDGRRYEKRVDAKGREAEPICIEDEIPFKIPDSWEWARLGSLVLNRGQKNPDSSFFYIDIASIDNINQKLGETTVIEAANAPSRARKLVARNDVLYATVRPYLHNACIIDRDFELEPIASTGFAVLTCPIGFLPGFLLHYLVSPCFDRYANASENAKGAAYPAINDNKLYKALVPISSTAEQRRIVSKVSEILGITSQ